MSSESRPSSQRNEGSEQPRRRASDETAAAIVAALAGPRTSRGERLTASCGNVPGGLKITNGRSRLFLPATT